MSFSAAPSSSLPGVKKVGLYGGSFDPVHLGHLLVAQSAREELRLDRLFFIPAAQSPFKPASTPAPAEDRVRLLRLALAGQDWCEIDLQEIQRGGVSFTIDTVKSYRQAHPGVELLYLIGADHVPTLPKWREAEDLASLVEFVVIPRPGEPPVSFAPPFKGRYLEGFPLRLSSSQIRARVKAGERVDHLVGPAVSECIAKYRLYL